MWRNKFFDNQHASCIFTKPDHSGKICRWKVGSLRFYPCLGLKCFRFVYIIMFLIITNVIFTRASFIILFSIKFNTPRFLLDHVLHWLKWIVLFSCKFDCNIYHKKGKKIKGYKNMFFFIHFQNNSTWQPWHYQQQQFPNLCFSNALCLPIVYQKHHF